MEKIEEFLKYSQLYEIYKNIFSKKQRISMDAYFNEDNSFSEIAEVLNISRQAVFDNIKRACLKLDKLENDLGIMNMEKKHLERLEKLKNDFKLENLEKIINEMKGY